MGKKKKNQGNKTGNPISEEEKAFLNDVKRMGYKEKNTLGSILMPTVQKVVQIDESINKKRNAFHHPGSNKLQILNEISVLQEEIKGYYKFIADCLKYDELFPNKDSDSRFIKKDLSQTKVLKSTLTTVLSTAFISMDNTRVYDDYSILNGLKDFLGEDLAQLLNRDGDYAVAQDMTPKLEDLVERHCKNDSEKGKYLKWLSDNGYKGIKTSNEIILKIESIIKENATDENLAEQNVSDYLDELFLDLSEKDIQNLNFIISILEVDDTFHEFPSYVEELFVAHLHREISNPESKLKEQIEKYNLSIIEKKYESIQDKINKKEKAKMTQAKVSARLAESEKKEREEQLALERNTISNIKLLN